MLKKYTSIPKHLYVNRNADEQLKRIVEEMQRPGYVLVARQMGKTNLLFNAKRTLEHESRLFAYVDLSNLFKYERDCYRNIIDTVIEPNEHLFESIEADIDLLREKQLPPHKEYSKSLKVILDHFKGDLVIVLDEIDALRSAEYSDNIFAQIRSNYFSRTNFQVFERLTYILSGVIEPTELIKDRNKSPFNIGDKIYLEDFSFKEHNSFIKKSELKISQDVSDGIYLWTNGNPRLTFDICSSLESLILDNKEVTLESLNQLIKQKYLTSYDIAPIDHIRELVKSNKNVRNAVLNIQQKKREHLSDEIKRKLYLFGIINSKFDEEIKIKNPIIERSLSVEWIKSVDKETQSQFSYGLELMEKSEYYEALSVLTNFISNSSPNKRELEICNYNIGFAYYKVRDLNSAIEYFSKDYSSDVYKGNSYSLLGICKLGLGDEEAGIEILEEIILKKTNDFGYRNALLNLAPIVAEKDIKKAIKLYDDLYISTFDDKDSTSEEELDKLRTLSNYYKAELYFEDEDNSSALESMRKALEYANLTDSIYIKYSLYNLSEDNNETLKSEVVNSIIANKLKFDQTYSNQISFTEQHLYKYLDFSFDEQNLALFEKLLEYSSSNLFDNKIGKYEILYAACDGAQKVEQLLKYILSNKSEVPNFILLRVYQDLAFGYLNQPLDFLTYFHAYNELFVNTKDIRSNDIYLYALAIKYYSEQHDYQKGIKFGKRIESKISNLEEEDLIFESLIIYYWLSNLYFSLQKRKEAIEYADKTIELINNSKKEKTSMIDEKGVKSIVEQLNEIKESFITRTPIINSKKYGRNEKVKVKYLDGKILENKYKKLEADIIAERCKII